MIIEVLRIGQRLVRDDRVTTHAALVSRAFGAERIYMTEVNPDIRGTVERVNETWGGAFGVEFIGEWRPVVRRKKEEGYAVVHLTMYGEGIDSVQEGIRGRARILVVVGAEKVPRQMYEMADYNVGVGSQPHSEIAALAVLLDRIQGGGQFRRPFPGARRRIVPTGRGKDVRKTRD